MTSGRRGIVAVVTMLTLVALAGCGGDASPADQVPSLAQRLESVDTAIEVGDFAAARTAVQELVNEAAQARVEGRLDGEDADQILQAAAAVLERLPDQVDSAETPTPEPTTGPETASPGPGGLGELSDEDGKGGPKDENGETDEKDKDKEKDEGSGPDPDDGHGN